MDNQVSNNTPVPAGRTNTLMCVLAYLGILSLIPFLAEKNDPFVQYHAKQGLNLFIIEMIVNVLGGILSALPFIGFIGRIILSVCGILFVVLSILGIVSAVKGEQKELPVIGNIRIIK